MPSLSEGEFFGLGISIAMITIIGFAMQVLSLLILCKKQFRKCDLTPYFLNIAVANTIVIVVDLPPVAASAFANKKLMGDIYCQVRSKINIMISVILKRFAM